MSQNDAQPNGAPIEPVPAQPAPQVLEATPTQQQMPASGVPPQPAQASGASPPPAKAAAPTPPQQQPQQPPQAANPTLSPAAPVFNPFAGMTPQSLAQLISDTVKQELATHSSAMASSAPAPAAPAPPWTGVAAPAPQSTITPPDQIWHGAFGGQNGEWHRHGTN